MRDYQASVARTRADIDQLRTRSGLQSATHYDSLRAEADALQSRVDTARAALGSKVAAVAELQLRLGLDPASAAAVLRLNTDSTYLALLDSLAEAETELVQARSQYGAQHPQVRKARAAMSSARAEAAARGAALGVTAALEQALDGGRAELMTDLVRQDSERAGLEAELAALEALLTAQRARLDSLGPDAARLEDLQRDFDVAEAVFASAIARTQSSKADVYASYPLVQVLEDPTLPDRPTSPRDKLAIAAGGAASMLLLFALSLGWIRRKIITSLIREKREHNEIKRVELTVRGALRPRQQETANKVRGTRRR